jgi:hypothetical protein
MGYEVGPDLVRCSLAEADARRFAVIDSIALRHTRPIGAKKAINGFADKTYEDDIYACLAEFEMGWPSLVSDRAILSNGKTVTSPALISGLSGLLLAAPFKSAAA